MVIVILETFSNDLFGFKKHLWDKIKIGKPISIVLRFFELVEFNIKDRSNNSWDIKMVNNIELEMS